MPEPAATPSDVRLEYDTNLDDPTVTNYIGRANREVDRYVDANALDAEARSDLEAALAAYWIATRSSDRAAESVSSGRTGIDYEVGVVESLRATIEALDPSGQLPPDDRRQAKFEVF